MRARIYLGEKTKKKKKEKKEADKSYNILEGINQKISLK